MDVTDKSSEYCPDADSLTSGLNGSNLKGKRKPKKRNKNAIKNTPSKEITLEDGCCCTDLEQKMNPESIIADNRLQPANGIVVLNGQHNDDSSSSANDLCVNHGTVPTKESGNREIFHNVNTTVMNGEHSPGEEQGKKDNIFKRIPNEPKATTSTTTSNPQLSEKAVDELCPTLEKIKIDDSHASTTNSRTAKDVSVKPITENPPRKDILIEYREYENELQMPDIMRLIQKDLSEPYSIYTYRYFIHNWPKLCFLAMHGNHCVGAIVCKLDIHRQVIKRGYIAMLAVDKDYRKLKIGTNLVQKAIQVHEDFVP